MTDVADLRARLARRDPAVATALLEVVSSAEDLCRLAPELAACGATAAWARRMADSPHPACLPAFSALWHPTDEEVAHCWQRAAEALRAPADAVADGAVPDDAIAADAIPGEVAEAAARHERRTRFDERARRASSDSPLVRRWLESELPVRVRCTACGRDVGRPVKAVLFDPDAHAASVHALSAEVAAGIAATDRAAGAPALDAGIYLAEVLTCPFCQAVDAYDLDPDSAMDIATRALAGVRARVQGVVQVGRAALEDGTPLRRPSEGLRILSERAEASGVDGRAFRRLANFALRAGRNALAKAAWERGAEDERELDCALALAVDAVARAPSEAFSSIARAVSRLPLDPAERRAFSAARLSEALRQLTAATDVPLTLSLMITRANDAESQIDLRTVRDWARLGELLSSARVTGVTLTETASTVETPTLERALASL